MNVVISFGIDNIEKVKKIREQKGKSIIDFKSNYTVIDIETTGLDTEYDEIIEIGALRVRNNEIVDKFNVLIKPKYEIDDYISELTGITNEMLKNAPSIDDIMSEFLDFIGNDILVGHNVNFDINFLYDNSINILNKAICNDYIDIMRIARSLLKELKHHRLLDLVNYYKIEVQGIHRALLDCNLTKQLLDKLQINIVEKFESIENYIKNYKNRINFKASDVKTENTQFDTENPFYNKVCVFTGTLEKMVRKDAMQIVVDLGGLCSDNVNKDTNYLILGNNDYCSLIKDGKSNKQKKAESLKLKNYDIEIISENTFYDMIFVIGD